MASINGTAGNDTLTGDDTDFFGNGGDDTIHGLAGNDVIDGRGGSNQLYGDDGDDTFLFASYHPETQIFHSTLDGGTGFDTLDFTGVVANPDYYLLNLSSVDGIHAAITIPGSAVSYVDSASNFEQIIGSDAARFNIQLSNWATGLKIISHSKGLLYSAIHTGLGNDTVIGGAGVENVYLNGGSDTITLNDKATVIVEGVSGSADHIVATATPTAQFGCVFGIAATALTASGASFDLAAGTGTIGAATYAINGFEDAYVEGSTHISTLLGDNAANHLTRNGTAFGSVIFDGRGGDDYLKGGVSGDQLSGGDGNDILYGGGANDLLYGGEGHDYLYGEDGNNLLNGEGGNDHIWGGTVWGGGGNDTIDAGDGDDYVNSTAGADVVHGGAGSDRLFGGADGDHVWGDDGDDHLNGNRGNDTMDGGAGDDSVRGGQDDDMLFGGDGNDTISGDLGNDTVSGGGGIDLLASGDGADTFAFGGGGPLGIGDATFSPSGPTDEISDFATAADKISLGFTPAALLSGSAQPTLAAAATAAQALFDGHAGDHEVAAIAVGSDTYLFFSASGGGSVDSTVRLDHVDPASISTSLFV